MDLTERKRATTGKPMDLREQVGFSYFIREKLREEILSMKTEIATMHHFGEDTKDQSRRLEKFKHWLSLVDSAYNATFEAHADNVGKEIAAQFKRQRRGQK